MVGHIHKEKSFLTASAIQIGKQASKTRSNRKNCIVLAWPSYPVPCLIYPISTPSSAHQALTHLTSILPFMSPPMKLLHRFRLYTGLWLDEASEEFVWHVSAPRGILQAVNTKQSLPPRSRLQALCNRITWYLQSFRFYYFL